LGCFQTHVEDHDQVAAADQKDEDALFRTQQAQQRLCVAYAGNSLRISVAASPALGDTTPSPMSRTTSVAW